MDNKELYRQAIKQLYIPIYSQPWWLDAVCGEENWDVWVYENEGHIDAVMPYYVEYRSQYKYVTKAPLTQNNGIIFNYPSGIKESKRAEFEERVIDEACRYISSLKVDVYEQQFQTTFTNWLPFFWNQYQAIVRYTYVFSLEKLSNLDEVWFFMDKKKRNKIKKGQRNCHILEGLSPYQFYEEVKKTFLKQNLPCPFSLELWIRLYNAVIKYKSGKIIYAINDKNEIVSAVFLVWDEKRMYQLISGGDVELQCYEGKSALVWYGINECAKRRLIYDFEGSVIKRISKSNRMFGAEAVPYFRIRKVFNREILQKEVLEEMKQIKISGGGID